MSASVAVFNSSAGGRDARKQIDDGLGAATIGAEMNAANEEVADTGNAEADAETAQEWLGRLATVVVKELRKGVDVGSTAAARAQAIRR